MLLRDQYQVDPDKQKHDKGNVSQFFCDGSSAEPFLNLLSILPNQNSGRFTQLLPVNCPRLVQWIKIFFLPVDWTQFLLQSVVVSLFFLTLVSIIILTRFHHLVVRFAYPQPEYTSFHFLGCIALIPWIKPHKMDSATGRLADRCKSRSVSLLYYWQKKYNW